MEAVGMQLPPPPPGRRKERTGEVDSPDVDVNEEEEDEEEEEEEEDEVGNLGSLDAEKDLDLSDQELDQDLQAQVLLLLDKVEEAQEVALKYEDESLELRGFLEDERLASALQAENFTKEIQRLQAQMRSLKDEFDALEDEKDVEIDHIQVELQEANEEIHSLRLDAEEAAALHENEVAVLQEEICRLKAELERVQQNRNEYDMEITALRAEISMKQGPGTGDRQPSPEVQVVTRFDERVSGPSDEVVRLREEVSTLREQYQDLTEEYQILQKSNRTMVHQLERLEAIKYSEFPPDRSRSKLDDSPSLDFDAEWSTERRQSVRRNTLHTVGSVSFKSVEIVGTSYEDEDDKMEKLMGECEQLKQLKRVEEEDECNQAPYDLCKMESKEQPSCNKWRNRGSEQKVGEAARAGEKDGTESHGSRRSLRETESKAQTSPTEWEELHEELRLCKEEIQRLNGNIPPGGRVTHAPDPPTISLPLIGLVVIVALLWCWWAEASS
ncbi:coiled-coil domain-containing protein 136 [Elgaria multicarinata webbii]|uniref:coiled-coil domain-containing protein 136 n=1 Tax=Elgaria multicarinata webbii TaxID=159646 RepID=UPI002FCD352E